MAAWCADEGLGLHKCDPSEYSRNKLASALLFPHAGQNLLPKECPSLGRVWHDVMSNQDGAHHDPRADHALLRTVLTESNWHHTMYLIDEYGAAAVKDMHWDPRER